jgi:uncharacterized cupin superfamily protein
MGSFSLFEREVPPGVRRPAQHRHPGMVECFYVLAGELALTPAGTEHVIRSGGFVMVPAGYVHTFGNAGADVLRILIVHSPALDRYFVEPDKLDQTGALNPESERDLNESRWALGGSNTRPQRCQRHTGYPTAFPRA